MLRLEAYRNEIDLRPVERRGGALSPAQEEVLLDGLLAYLAEEEGEKLPEGLGFSDKQTCFRALCNRRPPLPLPESWWRDQDAYLWSQTLKRGVVRAKGLEYRGGIALYKGDITRLDADAIVNAANSALLGCFQPLHGCIDNAIGSRGGAQIRRDCAAIMRLQGRPEPAGGAKVTRAYNLPSKYILHTVGPVVCGRPSPADGEKLQSCYVSCLELAAELGLSELAFCCISTGVYCYPGKEACQTAVAAVRDWKLRARRPIRVIFDVFSEEDYKLYERELRESAE